MEQVIALVERNRLIVAALARLRKSSAGAGVMELERHIDPEGAALMESRQVGDAAAQHSASQKAGRGPEELAAEGYDQDLLLGLMDEPRPSSSAPQPAQSTGILIGQRKQPLYSEDAPLISGLERALIKGGFSKSLPSCTEVLFVALAVGFSQKKTEHSCSARQPVADRWR
ncbi:hypothetical protein [Bradyrhizobium sp. B120]|uniref:hypothetical protein n=1 Tax=Bradyrhizobium sp. B120 TaxID=3410088 RepID=UPI003B982C4B